MADIYLDACCFIFARCGDRHARHGAPRRTAPTGDDSALQTDAIHLETFLAEARAAHDRGVPRYVERDGGTSFLVAQPTGTSVLQRFWQWWHRVQNTQ